MKIESYKMNTKNQITKWLLTVAILLQMPGPSCSLVTTSFKFISYQNPQSLKRDGTRCDPTTDCDLELIFCFDRINGDTSDLNTCPFGKERSGVYVDKTMITFDVDKGLTQNPYMYDVQDSERGVLLKVEVLDHDNKTHSVLVDRMWYNFAIGQAIAHGQNGTTPQTQEIMGSNGNRLSVQFVHQCAEYYYIHLEKCGRYCQARDDKYGHYNCDPQGGTTCKPGWVDTHNHCKDPDPECINHVCMNGGECINGQGCMCPKGFEGFYCSDIDECTEGTGRFGPCSEQFSVRCENTLGDYVCHCKLQYKGKECQQYDPDAGNALPTAADAGGVVSKPGFDIKKNLGLIIGLSVGLLVLLFIAILVIIWGLQQRRKKGNQRENNNDVQTERNTSTGTRGANNLETAERGSSVRFNRGSKSSTQSDLPPSAKAIEAGILSASYKADGPQANGVDPREYADHNPLVKGDEKPVRSVGNQYEYVIEK